jgi:hypothetical protein
MTRSANPGPTVAEIQGLYGPFMFSEKLLQQIWARGDFDRSRLVTTDGRRVGVLHPGRWNALGGPDFRGARLRFDGGDVVQGDVELHLQAGDWAAHRHAADPAYDRVCLHVVLFPPPADHRTVAGDGRAIPVAALLFLLHCDLEEYAAEAAVEQLAGRPLDHALRLLRGLAPDELAAELVNRSERRWAQKVHFARLRLARLGWAQACHHAALEILGYRFNRAPMLRVAAAHPPAVWTGGERGADEIFATESWSLQGVRPANHPRTRLRQYAAWTTAVPDWPVRLEAFGRELPEVVASEETARVRREHRLVALSERWRAQICADQAGGSRWNNLVTDGWLPLLAARTDRALHGLWHHWFPGDLPPTWLRALRELDVFRSPSAPACHGPAQGLLDRLLASGPPGDRPRA